jgi:stage 0 sporulation regulatory protein
MTLMERLLAKIEEKRNDMLNMAIIYGLNSQKTIQLSQELDELLNTYNKDLKGFTFDFIQNQQKVM